MSDNPQMDLARKFLEQTGINVFLTGKAGTGKTSFLRDLRQSSPKRMIVVAPTGVAAINAGGVTIHSFFQLPFGPHLPGVLRTGGEKRMNFSKEKIAVIRSLDLLVIDEISMVRADLLDAMNDVLRRYRDRDKPFGGVQLLMIGDLQQLAPVVKQPEWELLGKYYESPYFFDSAALREAKYITLELKHVYRQSDTGFIDILNRVRENTVTPDILERLNSRYVPGFVPDDKDGYITLTSHNDTARAINERRMAGLDTPPHTFSCDIEGDFPEYLFPTDRELTLKAGAQVMFVKNDPTGLQRYFNGKIGRITRIGESKIEVALDDLAEPVEVEPGEWTNVKYTVDPQTREISETVEGIFRQYPLRAAWAITIHKSQGLTFDRVIIDAAHSFSHGQVYVALSRCRSFEGLVLRTPLQKKRDHQRFGGCGFQQEHGDRPARRNPLRRTAPDILPLSSDRHVRFHILENQNIHGAKSIQRTPCENLPEIDRNVECRFGTVHLGNRRHKRKIPISTGCAPDRIVRSGDRQAVDGPYRESPVVFSCEVRGDRHASDESERHRH